MRLLGHLGLAFIVLACAAGCGSKDERKLIEEAQAQLDKGEQRAAVVQLKATLQKNPQSGPARLLLGKTLLALNDFSTAAVELRKARELKQSDDLVVPLLVSALTSSGQAKLAVEMLSKVELTTPRAVAELKANLAVAYAALGDRTNTIDHVAAALKADPAYVPARVMNARFVAGKGEFDASLKLIDGIIVSDPKSADAWQFKGDLLRHAKDDDEGGGAAYKRALEINPKHLGAFTGMMALSLNRGDLPTMKSLLAKAKAASPNQPYVTFAEAQVAFVSGDLKTARDRIQFLLKSWRDHPGIHQLGGMIEYSTGALLQAETHFSRVLQLAPNNFSARKMLAQTYLRSGQPTKALAALQSLLDRPDPISVVLGLAAEAYLNAGNAASAEAYFTRAAKADPKDIRFKTAVAVTRIARGQAEAGFAELEAIASSDKDTFADMALISARLRRNDFDGALKQIDKLQKKSPGTATAHDLRGRIFLRQNKLDEARASFEQALAADAAFFASAASLAAMDVVAKTPERAQKRFEGLLAKDPGNVQVIVALADIRMGMHAPQKEVVSLLSDAIKASPSDPVPRLRLIELLLADKDYKPALAAAQEANAAVQGDARLLDALGRAQYLSGEVQQALTSFRKIVALDARQALPYVRLSEVFKITKDLDAAAQNLKRALAVTPNLIAAQASLLQMAIERKDFAEAKGIVKTIQTQRPKEPIGFELEGDVHVAQGAAAGAVQAYRLAFDRAQEPRLVVKLHGQMLASNRAQADAFLNAWVAEKPKNALVLTYIADRLLVDKDYPGAELRYRDVLLLEPNNVTVLNNLSWLLVEQKKPGGLAMAEKANTLDPNRAQLLDTLASAQAAEGKFDKALESQKKAIALEPNWHLSRLHLAHIAMQAGNKALAKSELERLAYLGDKFNGQAEVAELLRKIK